MKKTSDALAILNRRFGGDPEYQEMLAEERVMAQAARAIYEARKAAGLSQKQLAELVGTQQPAIARLEDGDYEGHSLAMLDRIARAIGLRVEVRFTPAASARSNVHASTGDLPTTAETVRRAARRAPTERRPPQVR